MTTIEARRRGWTCGTRARSMATRLVFLDTLYKPDSPALLEEVVTIRDFR